MTAPRGQRSSMSSASASSTPACVDAGPVVGLQDRADAVQVGVLLARGPQDRGHERDLAVREAVELGREHDVGRVLVAVEEVDAAPDVGDAGRVAERLGQLGRARQQAAASRVATRRTARGRGRRPRP